MRQGGKQKQLLSAWLNCCAAVGPEHTEPTKGFYVHFTDTVDLPSR